MGIKFQNPPINELIIGLYFDRPMLVRSEHIGMFWGSVRNQFPKIQQQPELPPMSSEMTISFSEPYPMPRFWLTSLDDQHIIQIQQNAFLFNWRKGSNHYPHYEIQLKKFKELYAAYCTFLKSEFDIQEPSIQLTELTYSNLIEANEYWRGPQDTIKVVNGFSLPGEAEMGAHIADFQSVISYNVEDNININVTARSARLPEDLGKRALVLELRARGIHQSANFLATETWFDSAHEALGTTFLKMTNQSIQRSLWKIEK
jgi:uncharacterized protein (TIGR04255 family)